MTVNEVSARSAAARLADPANRHSPAELNRSSERTVRMSSYRVTSHAGWPSCSSTGTTGQVSRSSVWTAGGSSGCSRAVGKGMRLGGTAPC